MAWFSLSRASEWKACRTSSGDMELSSMNLSKWLSSSDLRISVFMHILILPRYLNRSLSVLTVVWLNKNINFSWEFHKSSIDDWFSCLDWVPKSSNLSESNSGKRSISSAGKVGSVLNASSWLVSSHTLASSISTFFSREAMYSFLRCLKICAFSLFFSLRLSLISSLLSYSKNCQL